jgi:hypothetical protein
VDVVLALQVITVSTFLCAITHAVLDDVALEVTYKLFVCKHGFHHRPRLHGTFFVVVAIDLVIICVHVYLLKSSNQKMLSGTAQSLRP